MKSKTTIIIIIATILFVALISYYILPHNDFPVVKKIIEMKQRNKY